MTRFPLLLATLALAPALALATPALAQHAGHAMPGGATPDAQAMMTAMDRMSKDMAAVPMTGDADREFAAMMIPHHQGAIDMARYQLAQGKDPVLRKLAQEVIAAQNKEIAQMRQWLAQHPAR